MERKKQDINQYRSMLFSIGYNMLGSITDAEDMVQETFISWIESDKSHVRDTKFYLIRTISNKCISHLKKLKKKRESYTGTWLPEPLLSQPDVENDYDLKKTLSIGFLYLLEKLTPIERGVLILRESFNMDYSEIASVFKISNEACRQHLSRSRKRIQVERNKFQVSKEEHEKILHKFLKACLNGDIEGLIELLQEDVALYADGDGNKRAVRNPVFGKENVLNLLIGGMRNAGPFSGRETLSVNGLSAMAFYQDELKKTPVLLLAIDTDENRKITNIYFLANPKKFNLIYG